MGCFDFTTADKGTNLRGTGGYLYLTDMFALLADLPNPLKFTGTDEYGRFDFVIDGKTVTLDVYAVYGCMADIKDTEKICPVSECERDHTEELVRTIRCGGVLRPRSSPKDP